MANISNTKSIEDLTKRSIPKKSDDNYNSVKKKNSTMNFVERRKNLSGKSPPNPFMSRINISSFLDLMMSDKNDQSFTKNLKPQTADSFSLYVNPAKPPKDAVLFTNSIVTADPISGFMANIPDPSSSVDKICSVCANELPGSLLCSYTSCLHYCCIDCWQCYVISRIENYEIGFGFSCLTCSSELSYQNIIEIIKQTTDEEYSKKLIFRLENFYLERALLQDANFRRCPNRGCGFGVSLNPDFSACPKLAKCQLRPMCSSQLCGGQCELFWKVTASHDCKYQNNQLSDQQSDILAPTSRSDNLGIQNSSSLVLSNEPKRVGSSRNLLTRCFPWRRTRHNDESKFRKLRTDKNKNEKEGSPSKVLMTNNDVDDIASLGSMKTISSRTKFNYSTEPLQTEGCKIVNGIFCEILFPFRYVGEIKMCPKCHTYVLKMNDGSCNHMVCAVCGCEFCWLCMRQITDMHYLSPSGCTFWGRRQWNVEKRALWQMGTLIGAPLAIGFLAALAIPAMLIGIPLYVGRKIHGALKTKNKLRKRTIAVAGGIGAFIVSPVIAAVAVGLGVPLILAYVYVVMPIALCRASACSCDETNPPQEELDFSDVENSRNQHIYDPTLGSQIKGDVDAAVATHSRAEVTKPSVTPTNSLADFYQPILSESVNVETKPNQSVSLLQKNRTRLDLNASSLENLRASQAHSRLLKKRHSEPIRRCSIGDDSGGHSLV